VNLPGFQSPDVRENSKEAATIVVTYEIYLRDILREI
jgi:hypothetical protein